MIDSSRGDVPCHAAVAQHIAHREVLDGDDVEITHEAGGELVQVVAALRGNAGVDAVGAGEGLAPPARRLGAGAPVRAAAASAHPLSSAQTAQLHVQAPQVGHVLASGQHRQIADPKVDTDDPVAGPLDGYVVCQLDRDDTCQRPRW